ncbi:hypothetical protein [Comamonas sp. UBA7528]|uniref:hypothetical protein n=1 Tax=Comamonas sp. UBA7528 TaxID=1946391 RepID=UPI001B6C1D2B|nr:hypothetical protein [Comamonas sp. UBA7528]MBP7353588.1 hypothetical protein [Comamonas sp.]
MSLALTARPGFSILSRVLAAVLGGYAVASAVAVLLAAVLPVARAEAVLAGMQWSFVVYVVAAIWAFSPVPLARVWGVLLTTVALLVLVSWVCARAGTGG